MTQRSLLLGTNIVLIFLLVGSVDCFGQRRPQRSKPTDDFLATQFWLGFRVGYNSTLVKPESRLSGFSPINYSSEALEKEYDDFSTPGMHIGLEMNFYWYGMSFSFQPKFKRTNFQYTNSLEWTGEDVDSRFTTTYNAKQKLDLVEIPIIFKYELIRSGKIRPFIMAGGYYSLITSAQKEVDIMQTDYSSGQPIAYSGGEVSLGVQDAFQNFYGAIAGAGVNLDYWNIRTVFEVGYNYGLSSITEENVTQAELEALGDINDELKIDELNVSLSFIFPFRFIDSSLKSR